MKSLLPIHDKIDNRTLLDRVEDAMLPLINLVFLLLLFFIVAGHLTDDPLPQLPGTAEAGESTAPKADLIVTGENQWLIGQKPVTQDTLTQQLPEPTDGRPLRIAADAGVTLNDLETLLRALEQAGYSKITLLTEPSL
ncbi:ExbD/TolR family protein [Marinobacter fonticola]|uniref:ExbD/TolR family protein n=1 Tax=Marinobacter fonticola TaxID=2603215 RepID=UPI0011E70D0F|nr:biopolymer transporter ExbD [Marinobacter fonticola]